MMMSRDGASLQWGALQHTLNSFPGVRLLLVTKGHQARAIQPFLDLGQRHLGENYVQEALAKQSALACHDLVWHFIGRIQSNKLGKIGQHFDWVESVCCEEHLEKLNASAQKYSRSLQVCFQYQTAGRDGVKGAAMLALAEKAMQFSHLKLRGLMVLPAAGLDSHQHEDVFREAASDFGKLKSHLQDGIDTLSMGMSGDYLEAMRLGATQVRIGSALLGGRP